MCDNIYKQLGPAHSEHVYQKALQIELYNHGALSVECEKHLPVFFTDSYGTEHTLSDERVDLFARNENNEVILFELKSVRTLDKQAGIQQMNKYVKSLKRLNVHNVTCILVNFPPPGKHNGIEYHEEVIN